MSTEDRKNSLGQVATGGVLFGAGMGASHALDARLKRKKAPGPIRAIARSARKKPGGFKAGTHVPHIAGKLGARGLQLTGLPLAAYGAANAVRPQPKPTQRPDPRQLTRDVARHATLQDQVELGEAIYGQPLRKSLLPGGVWKPATQLSPGARAVVRRGGVHAQARGMSRRDRRTKNTLDALKKDPAIAGIMREIETGTPIRTDRVKGRALPVYKVPEMGQMVAAVNPLTRGPQRKAGFAMVEGDHGFPKSISKPFTRHERVHATVRKPRSAAIRRFADPRKGLAEEARADQAMGRMKGISAYRNAAMPATETMRDLRRVIPDADKMPSTVLFNMARTSRDQARGVLSQHPNFRRGNFDENLKAYRASEAKQRGVRKALTEREQRSLDRHRAVGRTLSLASGTMGLTALGLRAPAAAKVAVNRGVKHGRVVRLAGKEQAATAHSNTLGIAAIGTGSAGSFNYAAQQKLERKKDAVGKGLRIPGAKMGAKAVGDLAERLVHVRPPGGARVRRPPTKSAQPDPRKSIRQRVEGWADRRAEGLMDEIVPWDYETSAGVRRGQAQIATSRDGSGRAVVHLGGKERRIPLARQIQVPLERQGPRGGQHDVGYVNAVVWPTKHVNISGMKIRQSEKGKGTGTELLNTTLANIRSAKTPGMVWQAGEYSEDVGRKVPKGVTMWRKPGIDYLPGMPVAPGSRRALNRPVQGKPKTPGEARAVAWQRMGPAERREVRSHTRAARTGRAKPTDVSSMSPQSQQFMSDQPWYARVPGGQPFLGKTRRVAGAGTLAGGAAYGGNRWEEHQHPRGYGGKFSVKHGVAKALPKQIFHAGKARRVLGYDERTKLIRLENDGGPAFVVRRGGQKPPKPPAQPVQEQLPFEKADRERDKFLRGHAVRISPDAERGYRYLKEGRNQRRANAVGSATMAGLSGWLATHELRQRPMGAHGRAAAAVTTASTLASAYSAGSNAAGARRWNQKMGKIEAAARSRRAQGLYGPGRGLTPVDTSSARARNLAKSMGAAR